ncbi:LysM peptidoglycan-binding domain-containing protein [Paenibacillus lentus]|uniref:LysM peptidoglycan-binding domain-containing protein n=1 Tax=Paenibacillus lentus TaxID=1338368 RepID=A0A3S8RUF6_9BACL|nr:LysM peptidoglycan-binding domain-containing protein [Paenibacillus lentus]AZK46484.1 LysM peptidoglycan-binding domain-containing protein [Paenibacillus lentus]
MADQSYGLRFDIYERVHLSEDVVGIEELEEIELFPKIQVVPGEEYAALRGHLLLSGLYRGQGESCKLEHWIPVEITIPLSRINKLEEIAVEIENFDVDLLSARSLNITGVLSLQGIETTTLTGSGEWKDSEFIAAHESKLDDQEETNFVEELPVRAWTERAADKQNHEQVRALESTVSGFRENSAPEWHNSLESVEQPDLSKQPEDGHRDVISWTETSPLSTPTFWTDKEPVAAHSADEEQQPEESYTWFKEEITEHKDVESAAEQDHNTVEVVQAISRNLDPAEPQEPGSAPEAASALSSTASIDTETVEQFVQEDADLEIRPQPEEKKELKIALNSKKSDAAALGDDIGISKLLSAPRPNKDPDSSLEQGEEIVKLATEGQGDEEEEVRWKNLFIGNSEDQSPFRKIRLVIVQREETLDEIAERYNLSTRELQLYNRLAEHNLTEGQVLYIP